VVTQFAGLLTERARRTDRRDETVIAVLSQSEFVSEEPPSRHVRNAATADEADPEVDTAVSRAGFTVELLLVLAVQAARTAEADTTTAAVREAAEEITAPRLSGNNRLLS